MPQTVSAILALMTFMLFSLSNQQYMVHNQIGMARSEVELLGTGVAIERLESLSSVAFNDLDLLNNAQDTSHVLIGEDTLSFTVQTTVVFVQKSGDHFVESATPTPFKEVKLDISGVLDAKIIMGRVFSDL